MAEQFQDGLDSIEPTSESANLSEPLTSLARRAVWEIAVNSMVLLILLLITIAGNMLVILAIKSTPKLQEQLSNLFIINLCATDMALGAIVVATATFAVMLDVDEVQVSVAENHLLSVLHTMKISY